MRRKRQLVGFLALTAALAAIVPTLAQGRPASVSGNDQAHYFVVSGGGTVDDRNVSRATPIDPGPAEVSGGGTVDDRNVARATPLDPGPAQVSGSGTVDDRNISRATPVDPTPILVATDGGTSIDFGNPAYAALALLLGLLAGGTAVAVWHSRRSKLSPA
jgi:hypothetical protein